MLDTVDMDEYEIITLFVGKNVGEDNRVRLTELLSERYEDCTVEVYVSGHEIYDYMIAIE